MSNDGDSVPPMFGQPRVLRYVACTPVRGRLLWRDIAMNAACFVVPVSSGLQDRAKWSHEVRPGTVNTLTFEAYSAKMFRIKVRGETDETK